MPFNQYQQMHYNALHGRKDHDHQPKKPREYALYEGNNEVMRGAYALLVYKKNELSKQGHRFLKIKPIKQ
jgi:hypothetical protein